MTPIFLQGTLLTQVSARRRCSLFAFFFFLATFLNPIFAQTKNVTGTVRTSAGVPLTKASVTEKGTSNGTTTGEDGTFSLTVKNKNAILEVSSVGYLKQEVAVLNQSNITITLAGLNKEMDEVVIIGYGQQRKKDVTAAISTVSATDLERTTAVTTSGALVGKVAGITNRQTQGTPGASTNIQIRNLGEPLYVIDGVMKDAGQFNNIDVNDIESISIIKDGAAAIYGVRAGNGVILVKTKRGAKSKPNISLNGYKGWATWARYPELVNAYDWTRAKYEGQVNSGTFDYSKIDQVKQELEKWKNQYYNPETGEDYRSFDWYDAYVNKAAPQDYLSASVSGGSDKVNYYVAVSHINQDAVFKDYNFNRSNFQTNFDAKLNNSFKVGVSMNGRIETRSNPGLDGNDDYWNARFALMRNPPTWRPYANDNPKYPQYFPASPYTNLATMTKDMAGYYENKWRVFQGNWDLEYTTPVKGLSAKFMYGYYYAQMRRDNYEKGYKLYNYDRQLDTFRAAWDKGDNTWMVKENQAVEENSYQLLVNYDRAFGDHHINSTFGGEAMQRQWYRFEADQHPAQNPFQAQLVAGNWDNSMVGLYDEATQSATAGLVGRVNYDYKNKYYVGLSARYDGTWRFSEQNRWGFFPSVSAGWSISSEDFFKKGKLADVFNNLKIRASYGQMGDDMSAGSWNNIYPDYAYLGGYGFPSGNVILAPDPTNGSVSSYYSQVIRGASTRGVPNTQISWVHIKMYNLGFDFGFLKNRLTAEVDGFYRQRSGIPALRSDLVLPAETGISRPTENLNADMHMGVDGMVRWSDKIKDFQYGIGVNATLARRKVGTSYGENFATSLDQYRWKASGRWDNVYSQSAVWAVKAIGRFTSQEQIDNYPVLLDGKNNKSVMVGDVIFEDINKDGIIDGNDERPIGYGEGLPYMTFGINLNAAWKGIDFAVDFAGATMQTIIYDFEGKWPFQNGGGGPAFMYNDRWHHQDIFDPTSPWVAGSQPAIRDPNAGNPWETSVSYSRWSSYNMQNVKYLRLKNLQLGYTLPLKWTSKAYISKCRFYFLGTNILSFDNMKARGLDPEQGARSGLDYPQHRVLTVGAQLTF